jgi:TRAP-type uncharacterized transport system fused permease subunit
MTSSFAAFRFALVGFTLPYMFVVRPALLMLDSNGQPASIGAIAIATGLAVLGILPLAAGIAGQLFARLSWFARAVLLIAAVLLLLPGRELSGGAASNLWFDGIGLTLLGTVAALNWREGRRSRIQTPQLEVE